MSQLSRKCPQEIGPLGLGGAGFGSVWLSSLVGHNWELLPQAMHGSTRFSFPAPRAEPPSLCV